MTAPLKALENKETPIAQLFGAAPAKDLEQKIISAATDDQRIAGYEGFLLDKLREQSTIDHIVKTTIDTLCSHRGSTSITTILKENLSKRRQPERNFFRQVGLSPKQLSKVIRLRDCFEGCC